MTCWLVLWLLHAIESLLDITWPSTIQRVYPSNCMEVDDGTLDTYVDDVTLFAKVEVNGESYNLRRKVCRGGKADFPLRL